jgi:glycosyltransferase involved in cell wall biosynthesis
MHGISVALATYNGERFLKAQLDSLADQAAPPDELVAIDDDSSDATVDMLTAFAQKAHFPVRVIRNRERLGYRANFMKAAAACACELIAFCDQDDIWARDKLSSMRPIFDDRRAMLAFHNSTLIDEGGAARGRLFGRRGKSYAPLTLPPWTIVPGHTQIVRRSLLRFTPLHARCVDPYDPDRPMPHDQWFVFWASVLGGIVYRPQCFAQYRLHDSNASGWPHVNFRSYVGDHLANALAYVRGESLAAENRLQLLQDCRDLLAPEETASVNAAIACYERLRRVSALRRDVYEGRTLAARAQALLALLGRGGYIGAKSETLGLPALLLDAVAGIPGRRRRP